MALQLNVNTYVTLAEANAYFATRMDSEAWISASDPSKESALVSAAALLDEQSWAGTAIDDGQLMAFPRVMEIFDPMKGARLYYNGSTIPERLKKAQYEEAIHLLNNPGILTSSDSVQDLSVGPIKMNNMQKVSVVPESVMRIIRPLLVNGGASLVWRAN